MTRKSKHNEDLLQRNFDSLKSYFSVSPVLSHDRIALPPQYIGAYSRRGTLGCYHISGAHREQLVFDTMRTYSPATCTKNVAEIFFEVASLLSVYYDTLDQLQLIRQRSTQLELNFLAES